MQIKVESNPSESRLAELGVRGWPVGPRKSPFFRGSTTTRRSVTSWKVKWKSFLMVLLRLKSTKAIWLPFRSA